jgi:uncharacterized protein YkwD
MSSHHLRLGAGLFLLNALGVAACSGEADEPTTQTTTVPSRPDSAAADTTTPDDAVTTAPGPTPASGDGDLLPSRVSRPTPGASSDNAGSADAADDVPDNAFCSEVADWDPAWARFEEAILTLVNEVRARGATCGEDVLPPAPPLAMNSALRCAAREHSLDMVARDYFDHVSPDGDDPGDRIIAGAGFVGRGWGENIAGGSATPEGTMQQWLDSPGHCENIMRASFRFLGVGYYPGGMYRFMWTQTFGA